MKKMSVKKAVAIALTAVMMAGTISVMPQGVSEVQAATTPAKDVNLNIGNSIAGLVTDQNYTTNSTIYYASNKDNTSYPWKIVAVPKAGKLTLLSAGTIGFLTMYDSYQHKNWSGSSICQYLNNTMLTGYFTELERSDTAIGSYGMTEDTNGYFNIDISQKLVLPSVEEVNDEGEGGKWKLTNADRTVGSVWWLRSPVLNNPPASAAYVNTSGNVRSTGAGVGNTNNLRPAFNLNLDSVLFTSASGADKSPSFDLVGDGNVDNEWKLTLRDDKSDFGTDPLPTEGYIGKDITVKVTSAGSGTYNQTSAMLIDPTSDTVVAYGKIGDDANPGNKTFTIPANLAEGKYKLHVFQEKVNGGKLTDYASNVVAGEINITTQATPPTPPTPTPPPAPSISSIRIQTQPAKTIYTEGEAFDKTGMTVEALYSDNTTTDVTKSCTISPAGPLTLADEEVTVSYIFSQKVPIIVLPKAPDQETIKTQPKKTEYTTGDTFDPTGLVLQLKAGEKIIELAYTEDTKKYFTFSPALDQPLKPDQKDIVITYQGKDIYQPISVSQDYADTIALNHTKETLIPGQQLTLTAALTPVNIRDKTVKWTCSDSKVAKVSDTGTITAVRQGTAVITATAAGGQTASCKVTVQFSNPVMKAVKKSPSAVKVSWNKVQGAAAYQVYRSTASKTGYVKVGTTKETSYTHKKPAGGKTYYYKVRALSKVLGITEYTGYSKVVSAKIKQPCPCGQDHAKAWFKLKQSGKSTVKVTWTPQKGATAYQVANNHTSNKTMKVKWTGNNKKHSYLSLVKAKGKNYQFKMRTVTVKNGKKVYGSWSSKACITMK